MTPRPPAAPLPPVQPVLTRRRFLAWTSGGLLCVAVAPYLPGCGGGDPRPDPDPTPDPLDPLATAVLLADPRLCGGCARCAITCSALHGDGPGGAHALVGPDPLHSRLAFTSTAWAAATCHMCPDVVDADGVRSTPACVAACPTGAAHIAAADDARYGGSRVRYIDPALCNGCGACVRACPFRHPLLDGAVARKCDLCLGRFAAPPCAEACPAAALLLVRPWAEVPPRAFPWAAGTGVDEGTGTAADGGSGGAGAGGNTGGDGGTSTNEEPEVSG